MAVVDALCGGVLAAEGNRWKLQFEPRGVPLKHVPGTIPINVRTLEEARAVAELFVPHVEAGRGVPTVETKLTTDDIDVLLDRRTLLTCFQIRVDLAELFLETGPLYDVLLYAASGELDRRRLTPGHLVRAQKFLEEHLARGLFRPTIALDGGWTWVLVYALNRPRVRTPALDESLTKAAVHVARLIHGARRDASAASLWLPIVTPVPREGNWRLRWAEPKRRFDPDATCRMATRIEAVAPKGVPEVSKRVPLAAQCRQPSGASRHSPRRNLPSCVRTQPKCL